MIDVFKYLSDLTARAHMLEGTINKNTGKFYTKEEIARVLGIIDKSGNLATDLALHENENETVSNSESEPAAENYISDDSDDEIKEDEQ